MVFAKIVGWMLLLLSYAPTLKARRTSTQSEVTVTTNLVSSTRPSLYYFEASDSCTTRLASSCINAVSTL